MPGNTPPPLTACEFRAVPLTDSTSTLPNLLKYYELARSYVQHEDGLINTRLTWSLTIDGFLFAIYGLLTSKFVDVLLEVHKAQSSALLPRVGWYLAAIQVPALVVAVLGCLVSCSSALAIGAAHRALLHLNMIVHSSGPLAITPVPRTAAAIAANVAAQTVALDPIDGVAVNTSVIVDAGKPSAEVVNVTAVAGNTITAIFAKAHDAGASVTPAASILLPRIANGGKSLRNAGTHWSGGAHWYYLTLPWCLFAGWILLCLLSAGLLYSLWKCPQLLL